MTNSNNNDNDTDESNLQGLFDASAAEPTPAQLTRMAHRAAEIGVSSRPWWRAPLPIGVAVAAMATAALFVLWPPASPVTPAPDQPVVAPQPDEIAELIGEAEDEEQLELAIDTYFDAGLQHDEDDVGWDALYDEADEG